MMVISKIEMIEWQRGIKIKRGEEDEEKEEEEKEKKEEEEKEEKDGEKKPNQFRRRLADCCKCKTSVVVWTALLVLHLGCLFSQGLVIDPAPSLVRGISKKAAVIADAYSNQGVYVHCLGSNESIRFLEPPIKELKQWTDGVVLWYFSPGDISSRTQKKIARFEIQKGKIVKTNISSSNKYVPYNEFGIEVIEVGSTDAGSYTVVYGTGSDTVDAASMSVNITGEQDLPVVRSNKLGLMLQTQDDILTLACGTVTNFGSPEIELQMKTSEGKVLQSNLTRGKLVIQIPVKEATDTQGYVCEIDWDQPSSATCLSEEERKDWIATVPNPFYKPEDSLLDTYLIPIVVVTALVVAFVGGAFAMMLKSTADTAQPSKRQSRSSRIGL